MPTRLNVQLSRRRTRLRPTGTSPGRAPSDLLAVAPFLVEPIPTPTLTRPVRVAAIGDFHARIDREFLFGPALRRVAEQADLLLIAGDLTDNGRIEEFELVAGSLAAVGVPVVAVPGNHDRRCLRRVAMRQTLRDAGVVLLDGDSTVVEVPALRAPHGATSESAARLGIVGIGGYGGGFWPDETGDGPPLHRAAQAFAVRARREAARLDAALASAATDVDARIVLMHYSPTSSTLGREPLMKYWMLGNVELAKVVDRYDVDLVIHGHAHLGNRAGQTVGGTPVRNVATQVIGRPVVYLLGDPSEDGRTDASHLTADAE